MPIHSARNSAKKTHQPVPVNPTLALSIAWSYQKLFPFPHPPNHNSTVFADSVGNYSLRILHLEEMEVDGTYPEEISSFQINQAHTHDLFSLSKKRKFLDETKEQQHSSQVSKYTRHEAIVELHPLSKQSLQEEVLCTHTRKGKSPLGEVDDHAHYIQEESTQGSNNTTGESFYQSSDIKSDVYAKPSSHDESSSSSSQICSMNSTMVDGSGPGDDEFEGTDEFGQCLGYLASACDGEGNTGQTEEEDLEELLYSNGMITTRSCLVSTESLITEELQSNTGRVTIDQEFEQYFSMLML